MAKIHCQTLSKGVWCDDFSTGSRICRSEPGKCGGYRIAEDYHGTSVTCPRRVHQLNEHGLVCALLIRIKAPPGTTGGKYGIVSTHRNRNPNTYNRNVPRGRRDEDDDY